MHPFIKSVFRKIREAVIRTIESYILETYGEKSKVCFVWGDEDDICFSMDKISGRYAKDSPMISFLRKICGQNILVLFGLPLPKTKRPCVYLFVFPSLFRRLGFRKTISLIKNWKGDSKVGTLTVIEYKIFGRK